MNKIATDSSTNGDVDESWAVRDADLAASPLGKPVHFAQTLDTALLAPIHRAPNRAALGVDAARPLPFFGADQWTAFELSWLTPRGKPQVAIAHFTVPCETPNIVESKSLKLYLASYADTPFASADEVRARLRADLSEAAWRGAAGGASGSIGVRLVVPDAFVTEKVSELDGLLLDRLEIDCDRYEPAPGFLSAADHEKPVEETLVSHLFKSNCPVTGQPDWASVQLRYAGPQIEQGGLLRYLVSFRHHQGFHEDCVERIFLDVRERCRPVKLAVHARFTRRGGLDINPYRTSHPGALPGNSRTARQ